MSHTLSITELRKVSVIFYFSMCGELLEDIVI